MTHASVAPSVFLSSTVLDFRDLRSSIRYWLRERGYQVLTSETPDFVRDAEHDTYESCFAALRRCQYYALLVGGRRGNWFDKAKGITVTQQEFKVALPLAAEGALRIVVFIREEVLTALRERRAALEVAGPTRLPVEPPSALLDDPAFIQRFVNEIDQTAVVLSGEPGAGTLWRYPFSSFEQVTDALTVALKIHGPVRRQALLANIRWEALQNLSELIDTYKGVPQEANTSTTRARKSVALTSRDLTQMVNLDRRTAADVGLFWMTGTAHAFRLTETAAQDAIGSGEFLSFDRDTGTLRPTPEYEAMQSLRARIVAYRSFSNTQQDELERLTKFAADVRSGAARIRMAGHDLAKVFAIHDVVEDIVRLSLALWRYAAFPGEPFRPPTLAPSSPIKEVDERLQERRATHAEIERWAGQPFFWDQMTGEHTGNAEDLERAMADYPFMREMMDEAVSQRLAEFERIRSEQGQAAALSWLLAGERGDIREELRDKQ